LKLGSFEDDDDDEEEEVPETGLGSKIAPMRDPIGSNFARSKPIVDDDNDVDDEDNIAAGTAANIPPEVAVSDSCGNIGHPRLMARLNATLLSRSILGCSGSVK
jgi:hypothetical protein